MKGGRFIFPKRSELSEPRSSLEVRLKGDEDPEEYVKDGVLLTNSCVKTPLSGWSFGGGMACRLAKEKPLFSEW